MVTALVRRARIGSALGLAALTALSPAAGQSYRERVEVGLVRVEVFVGGSDGRPVVDLKPSEVRLRVDGRPVAVDGLALVSAPAAGDAPHAAGEGSIRSPSPRVPSSPPPGAPTDQIAILIDETTTEQFNRNSIYLRLRQFLETLPAGATVLLQRFDGTLHVTCPWTSERPLLLASLEEMRSRSALPRLRDRTDSSGTAGDFDSPELGA